MTPAPGTATVSGCFSSLALLFAQRQGLLAGRMQRLLVTVVPVSTAAPPGKARGR